MGMFNTLKNIDKEDSDKEKLRLDLEEAKKKVVNPPLQPIERIRPPASKPANPQVSKPVSQQTGLPASSFASKPANIQTSKLLKKFTSYLTEESVKSLKRVAFDSDRKDYEVLQEAVNYYLQRKK
jgi:hypothetical protein